MVFFGEPRTRGCRTCRGKPTGDDRPVDGAGSSYRCLAARSIFRSKVSTISVTGWNIHFDEVEVSAAQFAGCGHFHSPCLARHLAFPGSSTDAIRSRLGRLTRSRNRLGPIFTGMENKWFVDEVYQAIIVTPFVKISQFLADVIDWRFWHDWFHETVIAGTYNWLSNIAPQSLCRPAWHRRARERPGQRSHNGYRRPCARSRTDSCARTRLSVLLGVVLILGYLILK